jgi:uncharacterized membrane protein YgdD (TMEM256/DUF423 family)
LFFSDAPAVHPHGPYCSSSPSSSLSSAFSLLTSFCVHDVSQQSLHSTVDSFRIISFKFEMSNIWLKLAGVSGAAGVALGAIGAHALTKLPDAFKETWKVSLGVVVIIPMCFNLGPNFFASCILYVQTGSQYHLIHSCALAIVGTAAMTPRKRLITGTLFTAGIVLFSGSCYTVALTQQRQPYSRVAPIGGFSFIAAWLCLGFL